MPESRPGESKHGLRVRGQSEVLPRLSLAGQSRLPPRRLTWRPVRLGLPRPDRGADAPEHRRTTSRPVRTTDAAARFPLQGPAGSADEASLYDLRRHQARPDRDEDDVITIHGACSPLPTTSTVPRPTSRCAWSPGCSRPPRAPASSWRSTTTASRTRRSPGTWTTYASSLSAWEVGETRGIEVSAEKELTGLPPAPAASRRSRCPSTSTPTASCTSQAGGGGDPQPGRAAGPPDGEVPQGQRGQGPGRDTDRGAGRGRRAEGEARG